jgi:hypothetical protein
MKKLLTLSALLLALIAPAVAQRVRLSLSDQKRFDSYYSRWQAYRATNNASEVVSMEKRMQDVYSHYGIPPNTPYGNVASSGNGGWINNNQNSQNRDPNWDRNHDRNHDWDRDHDRDHDWARHREWERRREQEREASWRRDHPDRDRDHHDNGLHRGWYKDHHHPHDRDHDGDHDRDHHDGDHHDRDHDKHDNRDKDHDHH